ncbi:response regulator transcription factor [Adhaeribacter rhizoryzae]|uniref:Response regulator transcription factor n=1 Tax=Adhaeribacter rhizoryzae TaxID=2607907 RepID=A0A5M6DL33_9BACT|nr:response regulator transcription factor [Adhaeribacter rhizoryzae]KAA5548257.1 response regulator transcription factor [Adhaeribacter rhizoryzae]
MISVLLFEDNKSLCQSLTRYFNSTDRVTVLGAYQNANDAVAKVRNHKPDVVLMDIQMPGLSGIEALQGIKAVYPQTKVLIHTVFEDEHRIFSAICAGASGYVLKSPDPDEILQAIEEVNSGGAHMSPSIAVKVLQMFQNQFVQAQPVYVALTAREREILTCMVKGMSYKMIADACVISFNTVHSHIKNIYEKLHVNSAPEAVAKAIAQKLV